MLSERARMAGTAFCLSVRYGKRQGAGRESKLQAAQAFCLHSKISEQVSPKGIHCGRDTTGPGRITTPGIMVPHRCGELPVPLPKLDSGPKSLVQHSEDSRGATRRSPSVKKAGAAPRVQRVQRNSPYLRSALRRASRAAGRLECDVRCWDHW